jgi:hypothetical protein
MGKRLAAEGYSVLVPNPFYRAAEHASAYTSAVLELLGGREPSAILREMPLALPRVKKQTSPTGRIGTGRIAGGDLRHNCGDADRQAPAI